MFKDKKEELQRLEEALLLEAQQEEEEAQQKAELEEAEALLDDPDDFGEIDAEAYRNYANQYGQVKAYNTDRTDAQLESPENQSKSFGTGGSLTGRYRSGSGLDRSSF